MPVFLIHYRSSANINIAGIEDANIEDIGGGDDVDAANIGGGNIEDIGAIIIVIHGINADNSTNNANIGIINDNTAANSTNNANIHMNISIIGGQIYK